MLRLWKENQAIRQAYLKSINIQVLLRAIRNTDKNLKVTRKKYKQIEYTSEDKKI